MKLGAVLTQAQAALAGCSDSPRLDAELLLGHVLGGSRAQLFARLHDELDAADVARFDALLQRRRGGEPVAYLCGTQGFWSLTLEVSPDVLVPRPETELLVEWALERIPARGAFAVADLGTGSGAIALALAVERGDARIVATDVSAAALRIARRNAQRAGRPDVDWREGSWWQPLAGERFDLIVSNPPYIADQDPHLEALRHEPLQALSDGADGLQALREIVGGAALHLRPGGWLLVEHGWDQGEAVRGLFAAAGFGDIATRRDLEGRERVTGGCRR
ncbi:peptide chain release factor N(5)-glutamine methyltransferase [Solimonas flava]|uniref:peptide chain release factor N(5)-glutamine methyltransferase n=1 Tax=Solimonas flava TaxID=415849 RepID=UPI0004067924|nr:peptide chain release factor N(5)-glutamine methyltransferase [Solimonas flava]